MERKLQLLTIWCNTILIANLDNKYNCWYRDMYPYTADNLPEYPIDKRTGTNVISRPLLKQTTWKYYRPENIKGYQIHYLQILRNSYQPWESFDTFIKKQQRD